MKKIFFRDTTGTLIGICIAIFISTFAYSQRTIVTINKDPFQPILVYNNKAFTYCREVEYKEDVILTINKTLIKNMSNNEIISISYPTKVTHRDDGVYSVCKTMTLPFTLEEGLWKIKTLISYKTFPFWENTVEISDLVIKVKNKKKRKYTKRKKVKQGV